MKTFFQNFLHRIGLHVGRRPTEKLANNSLARWMWIQHRIHPIWQSDPHQRKLPRYPSNRVCSTRYHWWNFIPKNLFEQFTRIANFYFLLIVIVQVLTPDNPVPAFVSWLPLLFVLLVTMVKQGYEDYMRYLADRKCNLAQVWLMCKDSNQQKRVSAGQIHVGDVIKLERDQIAPCDLLLLESSNVNGVCYINTASLDGETNLKERQVAAALLQNNSPHTDNDVYGKVDSALPDPQLNKLHVKLTLFHAQDSTPLAEVSLSDEKYFVLRETRLVNTDWIIGCALYTGPDTKIALNSKRKRLKRSSVENCLNVFIISYLCLIVVFCVVLTLLQIYFFTYLQGLKFAWFLPPLPDMKKVITLTYAFLQFVILHHTMIPISLYVTIEVFKFFSLPFFNHDVAMYHPEQGLGASANTSDLNEELGQIEHLFSDKTGTLTRNEMKFKCLADASGRVHVFEDCDLVPLEVDGSTTSEDTSSSPLSPLMRLLSTSLSAANADHEREFGFGSIALASSTPRGHLRHMSSFKEDDDRARSDSSGSFEGRVKRGTLQRLMLCLVLCHSVRYDKEKDCYEAESPDEKAFIEACRDLKIRFLGHDELDATVQQVEYRNVTFKFRQHCLVKFTPERKMCTVMVENLLTGKCYLLCKGADIMLYSRLAHAQKSTQIRTRIEKRVRDFTSQGLRALVFAERKITKDAMLEMCAQLAQADLEEDATSARAALLEKIENEFVLLGCTGVEDRLQENVPETVNLLAEAGIRIWILTGDTMKTALSVSQMCGHSSIDAVPFDLTGQGSEEEMVTQMDAFLRRTWDDGTPREIGYPLQPNYQSMTTTPLNAKEKYCELLVLDGTSMEHILTSKSKENLNLFVKVVGVFKAVLCCRMSPRQKAGLVKLVRERLRDSVHGRHLPITAAVGDGANDVAMIQEAHVGFGLHGKEGTQAIRAADFVLAQFQDLRHAILFHGYNNYYRLAVMVLFFFYKNFVMGFGHFIYALFNGVSGQTAYPSVYIMLYNTVFTSLVIFLYSLLDMPMERQRILARPQLYARIRHNALLSWPRFIVWNALGAWHCVVVFGVLLWSAWVNDIVDSAGATQSLYGLGTLAMLAVVIIVHVRIALETHTVNLPMVAGYVLTLVGIALGMIVSNALLIEDVLPYYGIAMRILLQPLSWMLLLLIVAVSIMPELVILAGRRIRRSTKSQRRAMRNNHVRVEEPEHGFWCQDRGSSHGACCFAMSGSPREKASFSSSFTSGKVNGNTSAGPSVVANRHVKPSSQTEVTCFQLPDREGTSQVVVDV